MRKLMTLLLALAILASFAVPAFAYAGSDAVTTLGNSVNVPVYFNIQKHTPDFDPATKDNIAVYRVIVAWNGTAGSYVTAGSWKWDAEKLGYFVENSEDALDDSNALVEVTVTNASNKAIQFDSVYQSELAEGKAVSKATETKVKKLEFGEIRWTPYTGHSLINQDLNTLATQITAKETSSTIDQCPNETYKVEVALTDDGKTSIADGTDALVGNIVVTIHDVVAG